MTFPRYANYRTTNAVWLGDVPSHWRDYRLKELASFNGGGTPNREVASYWGGHIPWVSPKDMKREVIDAAEEYITADGLNNSAAALVPPRQVLLVVRSGILKHTIPVAINSIDVALNQDMKALSFRHDTMLSEFFLRWVQGLNDQLLIAWAKQGATVESLEHAYISETVLPTPPIAEQKAIVGFLDRETAKIDALVAEQERMIDLLAEKRQVAISHAITKGLDADAPMKPSNIEGLGDVPSHWWLTRLKHEVKLIADCPHETPAYSDDGSYRVIRTADLDGGRLHVAQMLRVTESEYLDRVRRAALDRGDIVYAREGERWGHAALVPESSKFCLGQRMMQIRPAAHVDAAFLMWALNSQAIYRQGVVDTVGATSPHVNVGTIRNYAFALPPFEEQCRIARFISEATSGMDEAIDQSRSVISLLRERRTALVSAVVTGKIDVRGLAIAA